MRLSLDTMSFEDEFKSTEDHLEASSVNTDKSNLKNSQYSSANKQKIADRDSAIEHVDRFINDAQSRGFVPICCASCPVSGEEVLDITKKLRYVKRSANRSDKKDDRGPQLLGQFTEVLRDYLNGTDVLGIALSDTDGRGQIGRVCDSLREEGPSCINSTCNKAENKTIVKFNKRWLLGSEDVRETMLTALNSNLLKTSDCIFWPEFLPNTKVPVEAIVHHKYPAHHQYINKGHRKLKVKRSRTFERSLSSASHHQYLSDDSDERPKAKLDFPEGREIRNGAIIKPHFAYIHLARDALFKGESPRPLAIKDVFNIAELLRVLPHCFLPAKDIYDYIYSLTKELSNLALVQSEIGRKVNVPVQKICVIVTERMLDILSHLPELQLPLQVD